MKNNHEENALFNRLASDRGLAAAGVKAELAGRHTVRLLRSGRIIGMWKQTVSSYAWVPVGHSAPQASVFSAADAVRFSTRTLLSA